MKNLYKIVCLTVVCAILIWACSDPFGYSPFEADIKDQLRNSTARNLEQLQLLDTAADRPFKIALISDSHYHLDDLEDAIADINSRHEFVFIFVVGDITENGLLKEFEIFQQIMNKADMPYLTVIGNHDHLSNGGMIYEKMFGPLNYTFNFRGLTFIAWDNNIWESEKEADYEWLTASLEFRNSDTESAHRPIVVSHIPPFDRQLLPKAQLFNKILKDHNVKLSVHGHKHEFFYEELFGDGVSYLTVGSPQHRSYTSLSVTPSEITVTKIEY